MSVESAVSSDLSGLGWPVKESFVRYVTGLPDGRVSATGGAAVTGAWGFLFPANSADYDERSGAGRLTFAGAIGFTGHFGMLALDIGPLALVLGEETGELLVGDAALADVRFEYSADDDRAQWLIHTVSLTASGAQRFGGVYAVGGALAPMAVSLPRNAPA